MKKTNIAYWIITSILALLMLFSGLSNIIFIPAAVPVFSHLGYPSYLIPFLGVAKTLGAIAILIPGFPRIKEWAYAGLTFDLIGAMYSGISVGDPVGAWGMILIGLALIAASYLLYHKREKHRLQSSRQTPAQQPGFALQGT